MSNSNKRLGFLGRSLSTSGSSKDHLTVILDDVERRIENMREMAVRVVDEREEVLQVLCDLQDGVDMNGLSELDKEELKLTGERLMNRCLTVTVEVETPRTAGQRAAWEAVSKAIEDVAAKSETDPKAGHASAVACYNACLSDPPSGAIDYRFQGTLLDCCAEDQKRVRRRLQQLIRDMNAVFGLQKGVDAYPSLSEAAKQPYNPNQPIDESEKSTNCIPLPSPDSYKDRDYLPSQGDSSSALGTAFNTTVT